MTPVNCSWFSTLCRHDGLAVFVLENEGQSWACATDSVSLVCVRNGVVPDHKNTSSPPIETALKILQYKPEAESVIPLSKIRIFALKHGKPAAPCETCGGSGMVCAECDGSGKTTCICLECDNEHEATCYHQETKQIECGNCVSGTWAERVDAVILGRLFNVTQLAKALPNLADGPVRIALKPEGGGYDKKGVGLWIAGEGWVYELMCIDRLIKPEMPVFEVSP